MLGIIDRCSTERVVCAQSGSEQPQFMQGGVQGSAIM